MPTREPVRVYPVRQIFTTGGDAAPWVGMRDARETTAQRPDQVLLASNFYLRKGGVGRAYEGRPGCTALGAVLPAAVQACETWWAPNGTTLTVAVAGGEVYRYHWGTSAWVKAVSTANLGTVTGAIATTGRVAIVPYASGLVFADGVNRMIHWTGVDGASGLTKLTKAPIPYGRPWVKSAKLMVINAANRLELMWSEEGEINLGYDQDGYNNAWELRQLGNAPLTAGIGTNDGQYLFRERSCFSILGEVGPDFQAASTRSDVSDVVGTNAPWSVYVLDRGVVFVDADAKPWVIPSGGAPVSLAADCWEQLSESLVPRALVPRIMTVEDRATDELLIGLPSASSNALTKWLAFDRASLTFEGVWSGFDADGGGMVLTDTGAPRWVDWSGTSVYLHGAPGLGPWADVRRVAGVATPQAIAHAIEGPCLGRDLTEELAVDTIEVGLSGSNVTSLTITGETPRGTLPALSVPVASSAGGRVGTFVLGTSVLGSVSRDRRVIVGQVGMGRWVRPVMRHSGMAEAIAVTDMRVVAFKDGADPDVT